MIDSAMNSTAAGSAEGLAAPAAWEGWSEGLLEILWRRRGTVLAVRARTARRAGRVAEEADDDHVLR